MEYRRIFRDGINLLLGRVGTVVAGLANLMILTRVLSVEDMGRYSLFLMVVNLALILGLNWSDSAVVRHGREELVRSGKVNQSFWARVYLALPFMLLFSIIFIVFRKQLAAYIGIEPRLIVFVIGMFVFNGLLNSILYLYQALDKLKRMAYVMLSQKLLYLLGLGLIFFGVFKARLSLVLILINLSFLLSFIITIIGLDFSTVRPRIFNKEYFRKIWGFSWPQLIGFSGLYIINYIDLYVIKRYMTVADVGVYSVAYNGFLVITGTIMILNTIFMPLIVEYRTKKRFDLIKKYLKKIPLMSGLWVIIVVIGILLSNHIVVGLFSEKYIHSIPSFKILLIGSVFSFIRICLIPVINAFDFVLYFQISNLVMMVSNIILDILFIPNIGITGAAYGTIGAYLIGVILAMSIIIVKKRTIINGY